MANTVKFLRLFLCWIPLIQLHILHLCHQHIQQHCICDRSVSQIYPFHFEQFLAMHHKVDLPLRVLGNKHLGFALCHELSDYPATYHDDDSQQSNHQATFHAKHHLRFGSAQILRGWYGNRQRNAKMERDFLMLMRVQSLPNHGQPGHYATTIMQSLYYEPP